MLMATFNFRIYCACVYKGEISLILLPFVWAVVVTVVVLWVTATSSVVTGGNM